MAADDLATQWARESAIMVKAKLTQDIPARDQNGQDL